MKIPGIIFLIILSLLFLSIRLSIPRAEQSDNIDSLVSISITVVGDLMCHSVQYNAARTSKDSFDFNPVYRYVRDEISSADFAFGNLETVTAGTRQGFSGYPFFNSPDEFITALKNTGFDLLTTSNNHSLDRGEAGVLRTIDQVTKNLMGYNGTFRNSADRDSIRLFDINGITIAFLAYSYGTNGNPVPKGKSYLINLIDTVLIKKDIESAKGQHPDLILVHYHFGQEYKRKPGPDEINLVKKTAGYGADIIIGGHPHVIQTSEYLPGKRSLDSVFVVYSLGNFISNQRWRYSDTGLILNLTISKNIYSGKVSLDSVWRTPTWVFRGKTKTREKEFVIIPEGKNLDSTDIFFSQRDTQKMKEAFKDTREIFSANQ